MLDGVPRPPGFQTAGLEAETHFTDRYQLGQAVAGAVACGWIETGRRRPAPRTMPSPGRRSRGWPARGVGRCSCRWSRKKGFEGDILPAHGNGWPSYIVEAAREMAAGHLRRHPAVVTTYQDGRVFSVMTPRNAAPVSALGCHLGG
jgi:hypothetical protein